MHIYARTTPNYTQASTASVVNRSLGKREWPYWPECAAGVLCSFCTFLILPLAMTSLGSAISTDHSGFKAMAFVIGGLCLIFFFTTCVYIKCRKMVHKKNRALNCNNTDNLQSQPPHSQALYTDTGQDVRGAMELDVMTNLVQQGTYDNNNTTININYDPPSYETAMANNTSTSCRNATTRTFLNSICGGEVHQTPHGVHTTGNAGESSTEETRTIPVTEATPETDRHSTPNDICAPPSCNDTDINTPPSYGNTINTLPSYSNHINTPPDYNNGPCASIDNYSNNVTGHSIVNYNADTVTATANITDISASPTTADAVPTCSDPPSSVICDPPPADIPPTANDNEGNDNGECTPPPTYSAIFFK